MRGRGAGAGSRGAVAGSALQPAWEAGGAWTSPLSLSIHTVGTIGPVFSLPSRAGWRSTILIQMWGKSPHSRADDLALHPGASELCDAEQVASLSGSVSQSEAGRLKMPCVCCVCVCFDLAAVIMLEATRIPVQPSVKEHKVTFPRPAPGPLGVSTALSLHDFTESSSQHHHPSLWMRRLRLQEVE